MQEINWHLLGKNFPTKVNIFHTNPNDSLKNRCHSKITFGHGVFQLLFESNVSLELSLLLNSSILLTVATISSN